MTFRVLIDAGHGGKVTPETDERTKRSRLGAVGNGVTEKEATLDIALTIARVIRSETITPYVTRHCDEAVALGQRAGVGNALEVDLAVSIHCNAARDPHTNGREYFWWPGNQRTQALCRWLAAEHAKANFRPATEGHYDRVRNVLRLYDMSAILVECGYVTNANDAYVLKSPNGRAEIAHHIAAGICWYARLSEGLP